MSGSEQNRPAPAITLLYFAGARTALPGEPYEEEVPLPSARFPLSGLRALLVARHGDNRLFAAVLDKSAWSVNEEMVDRDAEDECILLGGETVGVIPGVSGG